MLRFLKFLFKNDDIVKPRKKCLATLSKSGQKQGEQWTKPPNKEEKLMKIENFTQKKFFFLKSWYKKLVFDFLYLQTCQNPP